MAACHNAGRGSGSRRHQKPALDGSPSHGCRLVALSCRHLQRLRAAAQNQPQPSRSHCPCSSWGPASCSSITRGDAGHPPPQGNAAEDSRLLFMGPRGCLAPTRTSILVPARLLLLAWHSTASCPHAHLEEPDLAAWQKKARQTSPGSCRSKTVLGFWTLLLKYSGAAKSLLAEPAAGDGCWLGSAVNPSSAQLTHALPQFITEFLSNSPSCGNGDLRQLLWAEGR